jgi:hypothetical protein
MKKVLTLLVLALVFCQCMTTNEKRPPTPRDQYPEKFAQDYIIQSAKRLVEYVPDHEFDPSIKPAFGEQYFSLLQEAWAVPVVNISGIGDDEWLYYFLSGNGGDENADHTKTILEALPMDDWNAYVKMDYLGSEHDIVMHFEDGDWRISNFDGTNDELIRYIRTQRENLRSIDWDSLTAELIDEEKDFMTEDEILAWISDFRSRVDAYFVKYPDN